MFSKENALIERLFVPSLSIEKDTEKAVNHFRDFKEIEGLVLIKDDKIGLYGNIELA